MPVLLPVKNCLKPPIKAPTNSVESAKHCFIYQYILESEFIYHIGF